MIRGEVVAYNWYGIALVAVRNTSEVVAARIVLTSDVIRFSIRAVKTFSFNRFY